MLTEPYGTNIEKPSILSEKLLIQPVILSGGSGSRLWPLSRLNFPKQFLSLEDKLSLFQSSLLRCKNMCFTNLKREIIVVANEEHSHLISDQLKFCGDIQTKILLEPVAKNTAPALTLAALQAQLDGTDPILVVMPADQVIGEDSEYHKVIAEAVSLAASGSVVILGVTPSSPETGYGYIKVKNKSDDLVSFSVDKFIEKPDQENAKILIQQGNCFWNSGIFILRASTWLCVLKECNESLYFATLAAFDSKKVNGIFVRFNPVLYEAIPSDSIDYSVIEKLPKNNLIELRVIPFQSYWSDLGSWDSIWKNSKLDESQNAFLPATNKNYISHQTTNTLVYSEKRLVATVGVDNLVVIDTPDALLVLDKEQSQFVKTVVEKISDLNMTQAHLHRKVHRPWGWYDSIEEGPGFKVKRILVHQGGAISLQKHKFRAEHWVVVKGVAHVINGEKEFVLHENQSTYIPPGQIHRLKNESFENELEIIEVQTGEYLGEDDIVRLDDFYGRN
jgi:mannose-1-phosphate guanylyltransferase/mannose-6-phosphate isomerase